MQKKKIILFGGEKGLKSERALELKTLLDELGHEVLLLPKPSLLKSLTDWKNLPFDWAILIVEAGGTPPPAAPWLDVFKVMRHPPFLASCSENELPKNYRDQLQCEFTFTKNDNSKEILKTLGLRENTQIASDHYLIEGDLKLSELSEKLFDDKNSGINTAAFLEDPVTTPSWKDFSSREDFKLEKSPEEPIFKMDDSEFSKSAVIQNTDDSSALLNSEAKNSSVSSISSLDDLDNIPSVDDDTFIKDMKNEMAGGEKASAASESVPANNSKESFDDELNNSVSGEFEASDISLVEAPKEAEKSPVKEKAKSIVEKASKFIDDISQSFSTPEELGASLSSQSELDNSALAKPSTIEETGFFSGSKRYIEERASDTEDIKTIKRYAALKEREAREKQASLVALRKEYDKLFEKLKKSDEERRRLQMQNDELELQIRTSNDKKDEVQHQWSRMESHLQENIKELQIRLDSAQYQATKAEKKLDDFRERVKNDIQKIRTRERELANRLELQKRDAEALLMTKDERLLQQKRDIDRLQFELDNLRERLFEESERSEERVKRLNRVIQSLKLAQGLLSGLEDPMNDNPSDTNKGKGEAA